MKKSFGLKLSCLSLQLQDVFLSPLSETFFLDSAEADINSATSVTYLGTACKRAGLGVDDVITSELPKSSI